MFIVIVLLILGAAITFAFGFSNRDQQEKSFEERLKEMSRNPDKIDLMELELSKPFGERVIRPLFGRLSTLISKITPNEVLREARHKITQSGLSLNPASFIAVQILFAIGLPAMLSLMGTISKAGGVKGAMYALVSCAVGYFLPDLWLRGKIDARKADIQRKLPDALDLLTVSVEAGLGFDIALSKVVEKLKGPLSEEFGKILHEVRMGKPRRDAMRAMADRVDLPDLSQFIAALVQADKLGVSVTNVLRVQSDQMRMRRRQRAEQQAQKAPLKMSFILVFFCLPALMIVLLGPAIVTVIATFTQTEGL